MATLRDAKTSELVAEGTPTELVLIVDELGKKAVVVGAGEEVPADAELIYDAVGLGFEPDAVRRAHQENMDGLALTAKDQELDDATRSSAAAALERQEATAASAVERAPAVDQAIDEARAGADV